MRPFKPSARHEVIIEGLSQGQSIRKIAASLDLNPSTIMRDIAQMAKRGYIAKQLRSNQVLYSILPMGMELMQHPLRENLTGGSINATPRESDMKIRLHRLQVKFDLITPVKDPAVIRFQDFPSKVVPLEHWSKNIIQFEDFTAIISTKSLIITGVQRYLKASDNIEAQESDIMSEIIPFAEQVESKIRRIHHDFRLKRLDRGILSGKIISREYAYEHHPIAEKAKTMRIDAKDGKPRIIVDQSKGFPELETVHRDTASEDMEMLTRNTEVLATADLGQAFQAIKASAPIILEQSKLFATTQDQISQLASSLQRVIGILGGMVR